MNEMVNKFLLAEETFTHEIHLSQLGFTYRARGHLLQTKKEYKN